MDRALKHGLGGIVEADPFENNQAADTFSTLQRLTLLHRLNDSYTCLVRKITFCNIYKGLKTMRFYFF